MSPENLTLRQVRRLAERVYLEALLVKYHGHVGKVARHARWSRTSIYRIFARAGVDLAQYQPWRRPVGFKPRPNDRRGQAVARHRENTLMLRNWTRRSAGAGGSHGRQV